MTLKSLMSWPLLRLKMMRIGRGFTVHSPFAYHFIMTCLREKLPYYAFRKDITDRNGRRLFRVAAYFCPETVCYIGEATEARRIIARACPRAREVSSAADFTYAAPAAPLPADFNVLYAEAGAEVPSGAMTFTNGRTIIAVRRHGLPAQPFRLNF